MSIINAVILGVIEGLTEFLPISSTAHLMLASRVLGVAPDGFAASFEIAVQAGAILAVLMLYGKKIILDFYMVKRIAVAFFPTAVAGLVFYRIVKDVLLTNITVALGALFFGGIALVLFEYLHPRGIAKGGDGADKGAPLTYRRAFIIGCFQATAIIPGMSRAAATIIGGLILGMDRRRIVEFSFFLAVPTMMAATGLDLAMTIGSFSLNQSLVLLLGCAVSMGVSVIAIRGFLRFIQHHTFVLFGFYRVLLGIIVFLFVI